LRSRATGSPSEWDAFVGPYFADPRDDDPGLFDRFHLYLGLCPPVWLSILIRRGIQLARSGQLAGWQVNGLSANDRLRRYLARALAWPEPDFNHQIADLASVALFPD
jgi:hypothetical protein